jgi:hypothetical protein
MFGTRDGRAAFLLCLAVSAAVHWMLLAYVRTEIGVGREPRRRTGVAIPFLSGRLPVRPPRGTERALRGIAIREVETETEVETAVEVPAPVTMPPVPPETPLEGESAVGAPSPFDLDSLDLLLAYPWLGPTAGSPAEAPPRMTGLQRVLRLLRYRARQAEGGEELAIDTKHGKFGVSPQGLLLGPIVIPLPLAPYWSPERRSEQRAHEEIRAQTRRGSVEDSDFEGQRERVVEWLRRRGAKPEEP